MDAFSRGGEEPPDDGGSGRRGPSFGQLAAVTAGLAFLTVLLGIWTASSGYGLTCEGNWPNCDALFGLLPASFGSFVEWFHRVVAMMTGFAILTTAALAWRGDVGRTVRTCFTAALVLTPIQVVLGALTVTRYTALDLAAHYVTGVLILSLLLVGTVRYTGVAPSPVEASGFAAAALVGGVALTPGVLAGGQGNALNVVYHGFTLLGYATLLALATSPRVRYRGLRWLAGGSAGLAAVGATVGRISFTPNARLTVIACLVAAALLATATSWVAHADLLEPDRIGPAEF